MAKATNKTNVDSIEKMLNLQVANLNVLYV